ADCGSDDQNEIQDAAGVEFDDTASALGQTTVQGAIDVLAASNAADGDTDDQNELSDLNLDSNNVLTLTNPATPANGVNLSTLDETVTAGEGITVINPPATQEFNVSVTNPVVAMG